MGETANPEPDELPTTTGQAIDALTDGYKLCEPQLFQMVNDLHTEHQAQKMNYEMHKNSTDISCKITCKILAFYVQLYILTHFIIFFIIFHLNPFKVHVVNLFCIY